MNIGGREGGTDAGGGKRREEAGGKRRPRRLQVFVKVTVIGCVHREAFQPAVTSPVARRPQARGSAGPVPHLTASQCMTAVAMVGREAFVLISITVAWQCFAEQDEEARLTTNENTTAVTAAGGCVPPAAPPPGRACRGDGRTLAAAVTPPDASALHRALPLVLPPPDSRTILSGFTCAGKGWWSSRNTKWYDGGAVSAVPPPSHSSEQLFCLSRGAPPLTEEVTGVTTHQGAWCPIQLCLRHERRQQVGGGGTLPARRPLTE
ncbi:hypothetical protein O3P69_016528 [Scylla paramamosain]|uniref:Uncharacterized protein n=1 Tax=Scylla paramamosain TaxID=85552 RepID=A0AAW0TEM1_SCYPA